MAASSSTPARILEWQKQMAATDNEESKKIIQMQIDTYSLAIQDGRISSAASGRQQPRYNPLIGGKSKDGIRLFLFFTKVFNPTDSGSNADKYIKFSALRILPFKDFEATEHIRKEDNDHTLVFDLGNDETYRLTTMTNIPLGVYRQNKVSYEIDAWHVVDGITVERRNGYMNITCKSIQPWLEGPSHLQMADLIIRYFSSDRYSLKALPLSCLESKSEVYKRVPRVMNSDGNETPDYSQANTLFKQETTKNVLNFLRENGLPPETFGHYRSSPLLALMIPFSTPKIREFKAIPSTPGTDIVTCGGVAWTSELMTKRTDAAREKDTDKCPYAEALTATAQSYVSRMSIEDKNIHEDVMLLKATCHQLNKAMGILNADCLGQIAGEVVPKLDIVVYGGVDVPGACTLDINTSAPVYADNITKSRVIGVPVSVYKIPYVPIVTWLRTAGVQIPKKLAFSLVNNYIKMNGGAVKKESTMDIKALKMSKRPGIASNFEWCAKRNMLPVWTQKRVYNLLESEMDMTLKLDDKEADNWRYYSVSNAVFTSKMDEHVQDVLRYHALPSPLESESRRLEEMTEVHADALRQLTLGDQSEWFSTPRFGTNGLFQVIFAVHRSIDHDDIEVYKNSIFDIENCMPSAPAPVVQPYVYKIEAKEDADTDNAFYEAALAEEASAKQESATEDDLPLPPSEDINVTEAEDTLPLPPPPPHPESSGLEDDGNNDNDDDEEDTFDIEPPPPSSSSSSKRGRRSSSSKTSSSSSSSKKQQRSE